MNLRTSTLLSSKATAIAESLIQAYVETDYVVHTQPAITLRVNEQSPQMMKLHKQHRVACSAFITAFNPYSQSCTPEVNLSLQQELISELKVRSLKFIEGVGQHPSNTWSGEPSLLVLGLSLEAAKILGSRFEQNALVWIGTDGVPELVLLR